MLIMITTAGTNRENIFDDTYDYACRVCDGLIKNDKYLPIIYELDDRTEWINQDMWPKANPGLGTIKTMDYMIEMVQRAQDDKKMLKTVLTKDFNIRETDTESWLHLDEIETKGTFKIEDFKDYYAVGGVDLSSTTDLTSATLLFIRKGIAYVLQKYFMPNTIERRAKEDQVPYDLWRNDGLIRECQDIKVDYSEITQWFLDMREKYSIGILWVGFDPWCANYWQDEMKSHGFMLEKVVQGPQTMSQPMKELEAELKAHRVNYNANPVLEWCLTNTVIKTDENDNIRPVKGRNQRRRVDGTFSLIDAYVVYTNHMADYHAWNGEE